MRILITGASGFVGTHLIDALVAKKASIVCLSRKKVRVSRLTDAACDMLNVTGNFEDSGLMDALLASQPFDVLFHLAGRSGFAPMTEIYRTNVLGTAMLLQSVRKALRSAMKVILLGSSAEYGASQDDPIREDSELLPITDYGISKLAVDRMGRILYASTGLPILCVRPFNIVGPGQRAPFLASSIAAKLADIERGTVPPILETGDLNTYRDFVDVRDVAAALIAIADHGEPGEAYNICSGRPTQAREVVNYLAGLTTKPTEIRAMTHVERGSDVSYQRGSYEKLHRATGWYPAVALETSLRDTLAYWRNERS